MILDRVTLTGADDTVDPSLLPEISARFPFVEWGILVSEKNMGSHRFPSHDWIKRLYDCCQDHELNISMHVCGAWVRAMCRGEWTPLLTNVGPILNHAKRLQLNFHACTHLLEPPFFEVAKHFSQYQLIFQCDGENDDLVRTAQHQGIDAVGLYDKSGGAGISPAEWPKPFPNIYTGYAGGIGPDNVLDELKRIEAVCGDDDRIWIDIESKLYTEDRQFSLELCEQVLSQCEQFVS